MEKLFKFIRFFSICQTFLFFSKKKIDPTEEEPERSNQKEVYSLNL